MIVRQVDIYESRKRLAALHILLLNLVDELRRAKLVRDVHVEHRILARRVAVQRIGHGHIDYEARASGLVALSFVPARQFKTLPVIAKRNAMARQVMLDRAALGLLLRMHRRVPFREAQPSRRRRRETEIPAIGVGVRVACAVERAIRLHR